MIEHWKRAVTVDAAADTVIANPQDRAANGVVGPQGTARPSALARGT